jgi:hypothetical protein
MAGAMWGSKTNSWKAITAATPAIAATTHTATGAGIMVDIDYCSWDSRLCLRIYPRTLGITPVHNPLLSHLVVEVMLLWFFHIPYHCDSGLDQRATAEVWRLKLENPYV